MKKGQLMGQPFVYIFLLIVAALILFFGIRAIIGVVNTGSEVEYNRFVNEIEKVENKIYSDSFGSAMSLEKISVPKSISEICFINRDLEINLDLINDFELRKFINISYSGFQDENLFFASDKLRAIELNRVKIENINPLCDNLNDGRIDIRLVNKGNYILAEHTLTVD